MMERLDKEIVNRGLAESRVRAQELLKTGLVMVNQKVVLKSSMQVTNEDKIEIVSNNLFKYVSRGGYKLEKALRVFNYSVQDKVVMDIGSSTGGFTDCCLQHGARRMICIDVGTEVMHQSIRSNPKVTLYENTNFKDVDSCVFNGIDCAVIDVSFISLTKIFEKIKSQNTPLDIICLVKPQFECGREIASKYSGVILSKSIHIGILNNLLDVLAGMGFVCKGLDFSPIKGGDGNIEYLGLFTNKSNNSIDFPIESIVDFAFDNAKK